MKTKEILDLAVKLYAERIPVREIVKLSGVNSATLYRELKKRNIKINTNKRKYRINRAILPKLVADYQTNTLSVKAIMKKYNIKSEQTLYRLLDEMDVPRKVIQNHNKKK